MNIVIIDYGLGNIKSIFNALEKLNYTDVVITRDNNIIMESDLLILPGVGSFKHGMSKLKEFNLIDTINNFAKNGKMILGICLGMQLLFDSSDEFGHTKGLGLIKGKIKKLNSEKLPNVSWQTLQVRESNNFLSTLTNSDYFYFIHSFAFKDYENNACIAYVNYEKENYAAIVKQGNIIGCQFHPEKSALSGLNLLKNIIES